MVWEGPQHGQQCLLDEHYALMGWDMRGVPTQGRLQDIRLQAEWSKTKQ